MLSKINISNLDNSKNSITNSSIYSDACENSIELEEHCRKMNALKYLKENKKSTEKILLNNLNEKKSFHSFTNNKTHISKTDIYQSFSEESSQIDNDGIKKGDKNIYEGANNININKSNNKYFNREKIEKSEFSDILNYRTEDLKLTHDNRNEIFELKKKPFNEIINNNNINNLNLSNNNIIINRCPRRSIRSQNNDKYSNNFVSIQEKNKIKSILNNLFSSSNSFSTTKNIKKSKNINILSPKDIKKADSVTINNNIDNNKLEFNKNDNSDYNKKENSFELNKNLNIHELEMAKSNIDFKEQFKLKKSNTNNEKEKNDTKSINSISSNINNNSKDNNDINEDTSNDLDNVTIITKVNKKKKKNASDMSSNINNYDSIDNKISSLANPLLVNSIQFNGIGNNEIDLDFLKSLRTIPIKYKSKSKTKYLKTVLELQNFYIDGAAIHVIKISEDGKYLSAGMSSGKIKLFEIIGFDYNNFEKFYDKENALKYLNFINEKAYKVLNGHSQDVIDLSWSSFHFNLLLSCSLDNVILWDVNLPEERCRIESFEHTKIVTCISFSPIDEYKFVTGSLDKFVRIWDFHNALDLSHSQASDNHLNNDHHSLDNKNNENSITLDKLKKYNKLYFNIEGKITAINYFPSGDKIAIGTHNGKVVIYEIKGDKCNYKSSFNCKNRIGKNSFGKKITSIEFFNKNDAVISSCDSRIRLMSMNDGKLIHKYKGYLNENSMIRSCIDYNYDIIITGSDDGFCYVWNIHSDEKKNLDYEYFKPYPKDLIHCSVIVPEKCYCNFLKKIMKITDKLIVCSIIINASDKGRLEVLLNIDEN